VTSNSILPCPNSFRNSIANANFVRYDADCLEHFSREVTTMLRRFVWCAAFVATINGLVWAGGEPGDFSIRLINSGTQLGVGAWDDGAGQDLGTQNPPVFGFDLGSLMPIPGVNIWTGGDPGHNSPSNNLELLDGQVLPVALQLRQRLIPFSILGNSTQSNLWHWDGVTLNMGDPVFNPVNPGDGLTLSISRTDTPGSGAATSSAVSGGNSIANFMSWGARQTGQALHSPHATTSIGQVGGALPDQGVYLVGSIFSMNGYTDSAFAPMLYLAGFDETVHDVAIDWAIDNYSSFSPVPEPGTWALLACSLAGGLVVGQRWRRRLTMVG
jgi:hypothetical protein